jgi:hypothetical protein
LTKRKELEIDELLNLKAESNKLVAALEIIQWLWSSSLNKPNAKENELTKQTKTRKPIWQG